MDKVTTFILKFTFRWSLSWLKMIDSIIEICTFSFIKPGLNLKASKFYAKWIWNKTKERV